MLNKTYKILHTIFFPILIILIVGIISWKNFIPGTWLSGWDTLHPEFDFLLYFNRIFYGVWQEHQGLGSIAVQAHASELPRLLVVYILSLFLPNISVRYFFYFLTLLIGSLGLYFFALYTLSETFKKYIKPAAFLGALYYLLNLTVVQHYFVPLEMFAVHFATLPWLFLFTYRYLRIGDRRNLFWFFVVNVFAAPMAHTPTLFYSYVVCWILFIATLVIFNRERKYLTRIVIVILSTFVINAFWMLPNVYYILKYANEVGLSHIHKIFTDEAFLQSRSFGTLKDLALNKNFLFNWRGYNFSEGKFEDLLLVWKNHLANPGVIEIGFILFAISLIGILLSFIKKSKYALAMVPVVALSIFFWINSNPPFTYLFEFLRTHMALFREGFRFPFTKFSILLISGLAFFFAYSASYFFEMLGRLKSRFVGILALIFTTITVFSLIYFVKPVFQGNLISPLMKVEIPSEYLSLFEWFDDKDPTLRIAKLPLNSIWGWNYHSWNYEGAGFTWFGLLQPTLDREFDRWSANNESFYNQASFALYSKDIEKFEEVLQKYQVSYLLLDKSVINAGGNEEELYIPEIENLIGQSAHVLKEKEIGFLTIYKTDFVTNNSYLSTPSNFSFINSDSTYSEYDILYHSNGNYISGDKGLIFPFVNFDKRSGINFWIDESSVHFVQNVNASEGIHKLVLSSFSYDDYLPVDIYAKMIFPNKLDIRFNQKTPQITVNKESLFGGKDYSQTHEFEFKDAFPGFVTIDENILDLRNLSDRNEKYLGNIVIAESGETSFRFYTEEKMLTQVNKSLLEQRPRLCSDPNQTFPLNVTNDGFFMSVDQNSVCLGTNLIPDKQALYTFSFEAYSNDSIVPEFCITREKEQKCLDSYLPDAYQGEDGGWKKYVVNVQLKAGDYWLDFVARSLPGESGKIEYQNFSVNRYSLIDQVNYPVATSFVKESLDGIEHELSDAREIALSIPKINSIVENFNLGRGTAKATNCDVLKVGSVDKINHGYYIDYLAKDGGVSCDYFDYPQIKDNQAYILNIKGQNKEGRSLKIYLFDKNGSKASLEELLPNGMFDESFVILAKDLAGKGYTLNLETRAIGRIASENVLEHIEFIPVPYDWLTSIVLVPGVNTGGFKVEDNNIEVANVKKIGTYKYEIDAKGDGLIVLGQGYDEGWQAFIVNNKSELVETSNLPLRAGSRLINKLKSEIPWLIGQKLEHVKVNSWANGFLVKNQSKLVENSQSRLNSVSNQSKLVGISQSWLKSVNNQKTDSIADQFQPVSTNYNQTIIIVYWPQYLEFLGFVILVGGFLWLIFSNINIETHDTV